MLWSYLKLENRKKIKRKKKKRKIKFQIWTERKL